MKNTPENIAQLKNALKKLHPEQIKFLERLYFLVQQYKADKDKICLASTKGTIRGYLAALYQMKIIDTSDAQILYLKYAEGILMSI